MKNNEEPNPNQTKRTWVFHFPSSSPPSLPLTSLSTFKHSLQVFLRSHPLNYAFRTLTPRLYSETHFFFPSDQKKPILLSETAFYLRTKPSGHGVGPQAADGVSTDAELFHRAAPSAVPPARSRDPPLRGGPGHSADTTDEVKTPLIHRHRHPSQQHFPLTLK